MDGPRAPLPWRGEPGDPPQGTPHLGDRPRWRVRPSGQRLLQLHGEETKFWTSLLNHRDARGRSPGAQAEVDVEVFGSAPVAVADFGPGRYEADPAGADRVLDTVDRQVGLVAVQMELPQVRQREHVHVAGRPMHADADGGELRRLVEIGDGRVHGHVFYHGVRSPIQGREPRFTRTGRAAG